MLRWVIFSALILGMAVQLSTSTPQGDQGKQPQGGGRPDAPSAARPAVTTGAQELLIAVNGESNPLRAAANQLSHHFGIPISYEEPAWVGGSDLMRIRDLPPSPKDPPGIMAKINPDMRTSTPGSISVPASIRNGEDEYQFVGKVLRDILYDHDGRHNAGEFTFVNLNDYGYSIVPASIRGDKNQWISTASPLSTRISFPAERRLVGDTIDLIVRAIADITHEKIIVRSSSPLPNRGFEYSTSTVGAQNEAARDVLARTLREMSNGEPTPKVSWELGYAINGEISAFAATKAGKPVYVLNFHLVTKNTANGDYELMKWPSN